MRARGGRAGILLALGAVLALGALAAGGAGCTRKGRPEPANTLHLPLLAKIKGLDPAHADDSYSQGEVGRVYEPLLQYHYLKRPFTLIPALAEAMPEVSADRLTYVFHLKKGVLFQDDPCFSKTGGKGRELTAEDVVYSLKRLADPKVASTGWWTLSDRVRGLDEWRAEAVASEAADYSKEVRGLRALDRYTVQIELKKSFAPFLYLIAMPFAAVVPREAVELYGEEFARHPVGTGPFRLAEFTASRLIWDRNPTFRRELYPAEGAPGDEELGLLTDAGRLLPLSERVVATVYEETQPMWLNFLGGQLDRTAIPKDHFATVFGPGTSASEDVSPELAAKGVTARRTSLVDFTHLMFNLGDPVIGKNKLLRQALSHAINEKEYIELFFGGRALGAQGPLPPGIFGHDPAFRNPHRRHDVALAKELLAKAGYPNGKGLAPLKYLTQTGTTQRQTAEFFERAFGALGVKLKIEAFSWPEFQEAVRQGRGQLWLGAWNADYPDPENFLQLYYSKNFPPGSNQTRYSNADYDRLYEKMLALADTPARAALIAQMVKLVTEDCPSIYLVHRVGYNLVQPWLRNYKTHPLEHSAVKYLRVQRGNERAK